MKIIPTTSRFYLNKEEIDFFNQKTFEDRRKKLLEQIPDKSLVIIPNKKIALRSNDTEYKFKPDSDFYYLTGFEEPNSICVLKKGDGDLSYILFVEPRDKEKEIWVGRRAGIEGAKEVYKANKAYKISEFDAHLKELMQGAENIFIPLGKNKELDLKVTSVWGELKQNNRNAIKTPIALLDPRDIIHKMRLIKEKQEIDCIQRAANISQEAHRQALSYTRPGMFEYELEAMIDSFFRAYGGNGPAYTSIVGSGDKSTILHYISNNKKIQKNDLVLIDAGCEYNHYASDITRTFPASKKFTSAQKDIYEIVLEAQEKAIEEAKPGKLYTDLYNTAVSVIVDGLKELGLLKGSTEKIIRNGDYKKFFMHKIGHWLGLDVHDAGPYIDEKGNSIKLSPGMVLTVEPGIYIPADLKGIPKDFRGIGIRIEDDILVTENGNKVLTNGLPKGIKEIEEITKL